MIATPEPEPCDDLLARAEDALRRTPVPDVPSEDAVARILATLHKISGPRPPSLPWRRVARWAMRSAAAVILAVGLGNIVVAWISRPAQAFAEVVQKLHDARTLAYRTTTQIAGQPGPVELRVLIKAPGLIRSESEADGTVTIFDAIRNLTLVLEPKLKSAVLLEGPERADGNATDVVAKEVDGLRKLAEGKGEPVGRRRIGDVEAEGFRVRQRGQEFLVWVDPGAKLPLRIDLKARVNDIELTGSLGDFRIDPRLDDDLFRFEPPAGYTLTKGQNAAMTDEGAVADLLRTYAENAEGSFPLRLDDWDSYSRRLPRAEFGSATNVKVIRLIQTITRVQIFLLERKEDYGYRPRGVKLGDADKILVWFRPKGSARYRALYGDLHAADVTTDQLPQPTAP